MIEKKELKHYYKEIKKNLICPYSTKKKILRELKENIDNYLLEFPNSDIEEIKEHFGTPENLGEFLLEQDSAKKALNNNYFVKIIIILISIIILFATYNIYSKINATIPTYSVEELKELN